MAGYVERTECRRTSSCTGASTAVLRLPLPPGATGSFVVLRSYGRIVGKVVVDGIDANLEQLRDGLAWVYVRHLLDVLPGDRDRYVGAERLARKEGLGLWQERNPSPPWEWRRTR